MVNDQSRYSRLANITRIVNTKLDLHEVLQQVTTAISEEIVRCDSVGIFLPEDDGTYRGFAGKPEMMSGVTLQSQIIDPATDNLAAELIATRKTIYIADTSTDNRPDLKPVGAFQINSLLALPISYETDFMGMVFLFDYGTPMNLTQSEIESVEAYVNMAAVAIQNAKTLDQKDKLLKEKQLLLDLARELSFCSTLRESLNVCLAYLKQAFGDGNFAAHIIKPSSAKSGTPIQFYEASGMPERDWQNHLATMGLTESYSELVKRAISQKEPIHADLGAHQELLLLPMISMGKVHGVVSAACSFVAARHTADSQIPFAQSIIEATAPVFSNLLYMDQLESMVEDRTSALYAANKRVNSVIESITDGFFVLNKNWEYTYINQHHFLPKGKKADEVLGKKVWDVFPETVDTLTYTEFHRAMNERVTVRFETQSDEEDFWFEVTAYPFDDGICCMLKNIKEKKKYEKELKRLANLDLIGQMAAGISHEIRNPMTTVRGFLQLMVMNEQLEPHAAHFNLMIGELDRANAIITEFLSVGNTRTSDMKMMSLNTILDDISPLIKIDTANQNKQIHIYTQEVPELLLNHNEIRQLIINLYRNGLEAMDEGQTLTIGTYLENENCVVLAVQDQGSGIDPAIIDKIGTPFYTTKDEGTGLGLGICYAVAARHNATITIETGPEGTIFFAKFPVEPKSDEEHDK
ncbi:GAF domain-containing protein [Planococcus sp. CP5-4]|uniref:GAF domain-containing sensor histidine kinase n=1 Tax=unclassified Planococcus (in: firmicutes) TaxID=2662419 RepID=UPI001C23044D|nr:MULTISPECIES: ATP-binding protein [unclassified Planococcus (in: firmicutes)]MBU9671832.1 GAF domain-containing protein [Planococcus sp. CP5-4_YE]MBV0909152.1 GAF domain-containing protein [Planococcus sp. CP5-4_UN]MBW6063644.1 GAF domain-containing protein [Planococcus sp. CP5-4]